MPSRLKFNERKATQVAGRFLILAGRRMPYFSLLKLMYFADREALLLWGAPITNDNYYALDHGPILGRVKDLMLEEEPERSFWATHISSPSNYMIELIDEVGNDQLSRAEEHLIDEIFRKNKHLDRWQLRDKSHELPEWRDPHGSSIRIEIEDILKGAGIDEKECEAIIRELDGSQKMQALSAE
jgi:uncharacterized phage-associated protein